MKKIFIRNTGIEVSKISFGTGSLYKMISEKRALNILSAVEEIGISHFDTAPIYGFGYAENILGKFLERRRSNFTLTTKIGLVPNNRYDVEIPTILAKKLFGRLLKKEYGIHQDWSIIGIQDSLNQSLRRLRTDYIDFLLLHEPEYSEIRKEEMIHWLNKRKSEGVIRAWGISGELTRLAPFFKLNPDFCNIVQTRAGSEIEKNPSYSVKIDFSYGHFSNKNITNISLDTIIQRLIESSNQDDNQSSIIASSNVKHIFAFAKS